MNIIITGASSGIGEEIAKHYANSNNKLFLIARREDKLEYLKSELQCEVEIFCVDVGDFEKLQSTIKAIISKVEKIDMVIANAGVSLGHNDILSNFNDFKKLIDINFVSIHALLEPIIPTMQKHRRGKIVLISSLASIITMPSSIAYSTSKRAINAYAEGLRNLLLKDNIQVINILPGFIKSEMTAKNNFKMPFLLDTKCGVKKIIYAIENNKKEYKFPKRFFIIIKLISMLPNSFKDKIIQSIHKNK